MKINIYIYFINWKCFLTPILSCPNQSFKFYILKILLSSVSLLVSLITPKQKYYGNCLWRLTFITQSYTIIVDISLLLFSCNWENLNYHFFPYLSDVFILLSLFLRLLALACWPRCCHKKCQTAVHSIKTLTSTNDCYAQSDKVWPKCFEYLQK